VSKQWNSVASTVASTHHQTAYEFLLTGCPALGLWFSRNIMKRAESDASQTGRVRCSSCSKEATNVCPATPETKLELSSSTG